jgi:hypothetical protein
MRRCPTPGRAPRYRSRCETERRSARSLTPQDNRWSSNSKAAVSTSRRSFPWQSGSRRGRHQPIAVATCVAKGAVPEMGLVHSPGLRLSAVGPEPRCQASFARNREPRPAGRLPGQRARTRRRQPGSQQALPAHFECGVAGGGQPTVAMCAAARLLPASRCLTPAGAVGLRPGEPAGSPSAQGSASFIGTLAWSPARVVATYRPAGRRPSLLRSTSSGSRSMPLTGSW